jgi:hypothetical protein
MDRLDAPDQDAIQGETRPRSWAGPEINPTAPAFTVTKPNAATAPCPPSCGAKDDAVEATALAVVTDSRAPPC